MSCKGEETFREGLEEHQLEETVSIGDKTQDGNV